MAALLPPAATKGITLIAGFFLFIAMIPLQLNSQGITPLSVNDFQGPVVINTDVYGQEGLLGYLSGGGADLCIELGFGSLMVQDIRKDDERFRIELYRMNSPEAAFGLYTLSVVQCVVSDTINPFDCTNKFQYQSAFGNFYLSLTSESGSEYAISQYWPIARQIMKKNPGTVLTLPEPFNLPRFKASQKNLIFARGPVGLQNSLFPWQELFPGISFLMYAISLPAPVADIWFARITFPTQRDLTVFLGVAGLMDGPAPIPNHTNRDGLYREYRTVSPEDPLTIYFLQSQEPYPIYNLINPGR
jgi:hypothetical protein